MYFATVGADQLWEGVVAVSNAGRKRGRGKRVGRKKITDLNRGQMIGTGASFHRLAIFLCFRSRHTVASYWKYKIL